jgi:UTP--glucose-1-phosphate uridylyltransferase
MSQVKKAVFPVAGMGTRFLPATKANPKEMLPIVDKPLIQYAVEEAVAAGIDELIFVTSSAKRAIEDHFDKNYELEMMLETKGKWDLLAIVRGIVPASVSVAYVRQPEALGLGHAVWCARRLVGDEPFAVLLADDLFYNDGQGITAQLVAAYDEYAGSVLAVQEVPREETEKYGIVHLASESSSATVAINNIIEKPRPVQAPSNLAVAGRYVLSPRIFQLLEDTASGSGGEIQLTDAIARLMEHETVYAHRFTGKRYDCGSKLGYLEATVEFALRHDDLADRFRRYLQHYCPISS